MITDVFALIFGPRLAFGGLPEGSAGLVFRPSSTTCSSDRVLAAGGLGGLSAACDHAVIAVWFTTSWVCMYLA